MNKRILFLLIVILYGCVSKKSYSREAGDRCEVPVTVSVRRGFLFNAIWIAMSAFDMPQKFGIANGEAKKPDKKLTMEFQACSIEEALDRIMEKHGGYRWEREAGIYNILPTSRSKLVDQLDFLEHKLKRFEVRSVHLKHAAHILEEQLAAQGLPISFPDKAYTVEETPTKLRNSEYKITISLDDITVRQCLNRLIAAYPGPAYWMLGIHPNGELAILVTPYLESQGYKVPYLSKSEFARYVTVTDRLAELRGLAVTRGLSKKEREEQVRLQLEYKQLREIAKRPPPK